MRDDISRWALIRYLKDLALLHKSMCLNTHPIQSHCTKWNWLFSLLSPNINPRGVSCWIRLTVYEVIVVRVGREIRWSPTRWEAEFFLLWKPLEYMLIHRLHTFTTAFYFSSSFIVFPFRLSVSDWVEHVRVVHCDFITYYSLWTEYQSLVESNRILGPFSLVWPT